MSNRWLRFGIALLALGAASAAAYRVVEQEQRLTSQVGSARLADAVAETALTTVSELKAALHAYIAEGQGDAFWTARAGTLIDRLRASILELDGAAAAVEVSMAETLDLVDRLSAAEQRARQHARTGEELLAGDIIFIEARDLLDAIRLQIASARTAIGNDADAMAAGVRRQQAMLATGAAGVLAFAMLLLVIPARSAAPEVTVGATPPSQRSDELESSARLISRMPPPQNAPAAIPSSAPVAVSLREAAAVCTDLGRVSQSVEISGLLERAAKVLNASGVIVWVASPDGRKLYPGASAGYDERLLARIGSIPRDATNVTAGALRDATPRTSPALGSSAAALAVPLLTPLGPVGVLSADIREVTEVDEARLAVAVIFAAQLASLLGSMSTPTINSSSAEETTAQAKAQA